MSNATVLQTTVGNITTRSGECVIETGTSTQAPAAVTARFYASTIDIYSLTTYR